MNTVIDGIKVNYTDAGEGQCVLLLHGWGSSNKAYSFIINSFKDKVRLVALDFPGFGDSDMPPEAWDVSDYVDFTVKFINALALENIVLVGHSFGGRVIIKMVGSGLVEPRKIILLDSAGVKPKRSLKGRLRTACFKTGKFFLTLPFLKKHTAGALDSLRAFFGSADYNSAPPVLRRTLVNVVNEDLCAYMPAIKCPTLLIWGENDTATPISDAKKMASLIPDSGLCEIKGAGHFSFIDSPYEVNAIIASFLEVSTQ